MNEVISSLFAALLFTALLAAFLWVLLEAIKYNDGINEIAHKAGDAFEEEMSSSLDIHPAVYEAQKDRDLRKHLDRLYKDERSAS